MRVDREKAFVDAFKERFNKDPDAEVTKTALIYLNWPVKAALIMPRDDKSMLELIMGARFENQNKVYWLHRAGIQKSLNLLTECYSQSRFIDGDSLVPGKQKPSSSQIEQQKKWDDVIKNMNDKYQNVTSKMHDQRCQPVINSRLIQIDKPYRDKPFSLNAWVLELDSLLRNIQHGKGTGTHKTYSAD